MIHKFSWGIAWILFGAMVIGISFPYMGLATGIAFILAGISGIAGV